MAVRSHRQGQKTKLRFKDVSLEEHVECGCSCPDTVGPTSDICEGNFDSTTCKCNCDNLPSQGKKIACMQNTGFFWDYNTCTCRQYKVSNHNRGLCFGAAIDNQLAGSLFHMLIGCCLTLIAFFAWTTLQYRKKIRVLKASDLSSSSCQMDIIGDPPRHKRNSSISFVQTDIQPITVSFIPQNKA